MDPVSDENRNEGFSGNNQLMKRTISKAYVPCFLLALTFNINALIDSLLAGAFFSAQHIAAIGIASAVSMISSALLLVFVQGTCASYASALGRGQRRKSSEIFTAGLCYILAGGLLLAVITLIWAEPISRLFGAATPELQELSAGYLRYAVIAYPTTAAMNMMILILNVYGNGRGALIANIAALAGNAVFSTALVYLLPGIGIGALSLGTFFSALSAITVCLLSVRRHRLPLELHLRREGLRWYRFRDVLTSGVGMPANMVIDSIVAGIVNQLIVSSALGTTGLAVYAVVQNFWKLIRVPPEGIDYASSPMMNICSSCHDAGGVRQAFTTAACRAVLLTVLWTALVIALSPLLIRVYTEGETTGAMSLLVRQGVLITLCGAPALALLLMLTTGCDATSQFRRSFALAVIPDSVIFPVMLALLLPRLGYPGIWISLGGYALVFLIFYYFYSAIRFRTLRPTLDDILHMDKVVDADYSMIDVTIRDTDSDISHLSDRIQSFLSAEQADSRVSYVTALCMDELATDIVAHTRAAGAGAKGDSLMDVKMLSEQDAFHIIIRNVAKPYNPLDFEFSPEDFSKVGVMMAQKLARKIDYNYLYGMNMITIQIEK